MASSKTELDYRISDDLGYGLGSGTAAFRLNGIFHFWKEHLGFNIHPTIRESLQTTNPRIADVATGTAIWLIDLAKELPGATLDGLDVTLDMAPPVEWLPPNITLRQWNIFEELPKELNGDPSSIIQKIIRMLKPGGWIQWDDLNIREAKIFKARPELKTEALEYLSRFWNTGERQDWIGCLPQSFDQEGLERTKIDRYENLKQYLKADCEGYIVTCEETARTLARKGKVDEAREFSQIVHQASLEAAAGAAVVATRVVCIGQKPVAS
ncbi:UMTA methyltransferase family protein [Aspergillus welwitschiae]|uniref:UMTA methyltransferase family protein n=1 Tax=Aspergillus welwitschiae TaxID=1341132 RepID=A0A3F3PV51_9EURO|nr:UMTA methyltransferase family protein [Aspergillus welwitschiae]RDH30820.1 UMTA methyltransferase family protein [Aspergillus welwitschiae]